MKNAIKSFFWKKSRSKDFLKNGSHKTRKNAKKLRNFSKNPVFRLKFRPGKFPSFSPFQRQEKFPRSWVRSGTWFPRFQKPKNTGLHDIFQPCYRIGEGSKLGSKWYSNSLIVQPNSMKLGTITIIYSIIIRPKSGRIRSNGLENRALRIFTPVPPCHRVLENKCLGPKCSDLHNIYKGILGLLRARKRMRAPRK